VIPQALKVLEALDLPISFKYVDAGYEVFKKTGKNVPKDTLETIKKCRVCLCGPMTTPLTLKRYKSAAVTIRKMLNLYANIRPAKSYPNISLKDLDIVIVRENTEGLYSGIEWKGDDAAFTLRVISKKASDRIARYAFNLAMKRKKKVTVVTKSNIMRETCGLFRETSFKVAEEFPEVTTEEVLIDAMSMKLIKEPEKFDVVLCPNLFGDILSDEAAGIVGSLGLLPSANIGEKYALFQPVHGSAPDIVGKGIANPVATILSAKMMLDHFGEKKAKKIEEAIDSVFNNGMFTKDLGGKLSTEEFTKNVIKNL
jgi:isocitrate dehydrogenase (NAD+)